MTGPTGQRTVILIPTREKHVTRAGGWAHALLSRGAAEGVQIEVVDIGGRSGMTRVGIAGLTQPIGTLLIAGQDTELFGEFLAVAEAARRSERVCVVATDNTPALRILHEMDIPVRRVTPTELGGIDLTTWTARQDGIIALPGPGWAAADPEQIIDGTPYPMRKVRDEQDSIWGGLWRDTEDVARYVSEEMLPGVTHGNQVYTDTLKWPCNDVAAAMAQSPFCSPARWDFLVKVGCEPPAPLVGTSQDRRVVNDANESRARLRRGLGLALAYTKHDVWHAPACSAEREGIVASLGRDMGVDGNEPDVVAGALNLAMRGGSGADVYAAGVLVELALRARVDPPGTPLPLLDAVNEWLHATRDERRATLGRVGAGEAAGVAPGTLERDYAWWQRSRASVPHKTLGAEMPAFGPDLAAWRAGEFTLPDMREQEGVAHWPGIAASTSSLLLLVQSCGHAPAALRAILAYAPRRDLRRGDVPIAIAECVALSPPPTIQIAQYWLALVSDPEAAPILKPILQGMTRWPMIPMTLVPFVEEMSLRPNPRDLDLRATLHHAAARLPLEAGDIRDEVFRRAELSVPEAHAYRRETRQELRHFISPAAWSAIHPDTLARHRQR